ncbi:MAG: hypothetical protein KJ042_00250 [Deltaproteobacteria bacterium]|nr:hypothetical protein [Deltaproteobacteria bacterium]
MTRAATESYGRTMDDAEKSRDDAPEPRPDSLGDVGRMRVLIAKLSLGTFGQSFTADEVRLLARMRADRESIREILRAEIARVEGSNEVGRERIENLVRMIDKICR